MDAAAAAQRGHVLRGHHPQQPRIPVSIFGTPCGHRKYVHLLNSCVCFVLGEWVLKHLLEGEMILVERSELSSL